MDITNDNVCSSMLSCFYSHLLSTGRPISSYIINHAAGFNRCSTELQDRMTQNIALLCSKLNEGKTPKEVSNALTDLRDLMAFHQRVSVGMGTSLQHIADSLFVHWLILF